MFDVHENAGFTREKNHSRASVSGNRCKFTLAKVSHTKKNLELFQVLCARTRTRVMFFHSDSFLKRDFLSPCCSWKALVSSHIPKRVDCFKLEEDQTMWYRRWNLAVLIHREGTSFLQFVSSLKGHCHYSESSGDVYAKQSVQIDFHNLIILFLLVI